MWLFLEKLLHLTWTEIKETASNFWKSQLIDIFTLRHLNTFFLLFWNSLILWTDLTLLVLEDRQNHLVRNQEPVLLVQPQWSLELTAFGRAASHRFRFLLNWKMLLFDGSMGILQGYLFTPELEKQKCSLWYQTHYLDIDFSSNLNFALITSEEKWKCLSTLWLPFDI